MQLVSRLTFGSSFPKFLCFILKCHQIYKQIGYEGCTAQNRLSGLGKKFQDYQNASESFGLPCLVGLVPSRYLHVLGERRLDTRVVRSFTGRVETYIAFFFCLLP